MVQQSLLLRAALKGGWISRSMYAAIATAWLSILGPLNILPGAKMGDQVLQHFTKGLETPSEQLQKSGALGRIGTTGAAGLLADKILGERYGVAMDNLSGRVGMGNVIPNSVDSAIAPAGMLKALGQGAVQMASGDPQRMAEGAATFGGKEAKRLVESYFMKTGNRGKTSGTGSVLVPSEKTALPGRPEIDDMDIMMYALFTMLAVVAAFGFVVWVIAWVGHMMRRDGQTRGER